MAEYKKAKTPPLSERTKLLSFDLESNGLHGAAFAVGAVVADAHGTIHDQFTGRCEIEGEVDSWVQQNVLPAIADMPVTHKNYRDLREAFWRWYLKAEPAADYVLVNNGYPVEYRFLLQCQEENLAERYWQHPFPILDLSSLLIQVGQSPVSGKTQFLASQPERRFVAHNPLDDAKMAVEIAFRAFRQSGQIT